MWYHLDFIEIFAEKLQKYFGRIFTSLWQNIWKEEPEQRSKAGTFGNVKICTFWERVLNNYTFDKIGNMCNNKREKEIVIQTCRMKQYHNQSEEKGNVWLAFLNYDQLGQT